MVREIECTVIDPPTSNEVLGRTADALADLASGEFELILQPQQEIEVPRLGSIALKLRLRGHNHNQADNNILVRAQVTEPSNLYDSVLVSVPKDPEAPATATVFAY